MTSTNWLTWGRTVCHAILGEARLRGPTVSPRPAPSPPYLGERAGGEGVNVAAREFCHSSRARWGTTCRRGQALAPLTLPLSPEFGGEGTNSQRIPPRCETHTCCRTGVLVLLVTLMMTSAAHAQFRQPIVRKTVVTVEAQEIAQRELLRTTANFDITHRIEAVLLHRQHWDFPDVPLNELMEIFEKQFQIPIVLASAALQDEGIDPDSPIPSIRGTMTLNRFLELILRPNGLTHLIEDGVLMVTTQVKADEIVSLRIYPVLDLVRHDDADDYVSLMTVIQEATSGMWEQIDGVGGTMTPLPTTGSLFIRQTWQVHREIEGLLYAARKARQLQHIPSLSVNLNHQPAAITVGQQITFGSSLSATDGIESLPAATKPASTSSATWRVPRVDRPRRAR